MKRVLISASFLLVSNLVATHALAQSDPQTLSPSDPPFQTITELHLGRLGDQTLDPDPIAPGDLPPLIAVAPLRLTLLNDFSPLSDRFSNCDSREYASGNATLGGMPRQSYAYLRLTPRLTLHTFSSLGCPTIAGMGGGFTYAQPLAHNWWFTANVGAYGQPPINGYRPANISRTAGLNVVKQVDNTRSWYFGIKSTRSQPAGVHVGTTF